MREYVRRQTVALLRKLAKQMTAAAKSGEADAIHDLRVAIRRLNGCLRLFAQFYPGHSRKKLRADLKDLMHASGEVRDRDIAIELLAEAGVPADGPLAGRLRAERAQAAGDLRSALQLWKRRDAARSWRTRLDL